MNLLIVDDHPINRKVLRAQLEAAGHAVAESANGAEALDALAANGVDGVISDILMPVMDGFRLCLEIRKSDRHHALPFVLYTGTYDSPQDRELAQSVGADAYVTKPAPVSELVDAVRRAGARTLAAAGAEPGPADEGYVLKQYNEALVRKLEERNDEIATALDHLKSAYEDLRTTEARFRALIENGYDAISMLTADAQIVYRSPSAARILGYPMEELLRQSAFDLVHPDDAAAMREMFRKLLADPSSNVRGLIRFRHRNGGWRWLEGTGTNLLGHPAIAAIVINYRDVTAQRDAEEARLESETRFRQIAENIREVFWLTDPAKNEMLYVSSAYEQVWGRSCESLRRSPGDWLDAIHPDDRERVHSAAYGKQIAGDYVEEYRIRRPDGTVRWIRDRAFPVVDETGKLVRIAGIAEDITERRSAMDALRESERRFNDLLGNVELVSIMLDRNAHVTYCNDYLLRLTGWRREEAIGCNWFERFLPPPHDEMWGIYSALLADASGARHHENEILTRNGERRLIRWSNTVLRSLSGDVIGTASIGEDVTERTLQQGKIEKLSRIRALTSEINAAIVRCATRQDLFDAACRIAVEQGGFGTAWVGAYDAEEQLVTPVAWAGADARELAVGGTIADDVPGRPRRMVARAIQERRPSVNNDMAADVQSGGPRRQEAVRRGYRSVIVMPLYVEDAVAGNFSLFAKERNCFDAEEVALLTELAGNVSFALDRMAKQDKLEKLSRVRALSSEVNSAIVRVRDREALLKETCRIATEHGKFEMIWIGTVDTLKQEIRPVVWTGFSPEIAQRVSWKSLTAAQGTLMEAIRTGKPAVRNDIEAQLPVGGMRTEALKQGCGSTVCLPLKVEESVVALIALFAAGAGFFDEDELALLGEVAADASFALQSLDRQDRVEKLSRIRDVMSEVNAAIVRIRERKALFEETCRIAAAYGGFRMAWIGTLDPATLEVRPAASVGLDAEVLGKLIVSAREDLPEGMGNAGTALRTGRPAWNNDMSAQPDLNTSRRLAVERGVRSAIALPLLVDGEAGSVLVLYADEPGYFTDDEIGVLTELASDVSFALQSIARQDRLDYLAYYDALTGLPNRTLFIDRLGQHLHGRSDNPAMVALVLLDVERIRYINETLGRHAGDELLKAIAARLEVVFHGKEHVARIGGDGFGLVVRGPHDAAAALHVVENQALKVFREPFMLGGTELRVSARAGIALYPADGADADSLFRNAEAALDRARQSGEPYLFYAADMNARVAHMLLLESRLRKAVEFRQFVLHYQPKVALPGGRICGLEALIRWRQADGSLVPPGTFIPLLEETGLILEVGRWALARALEDHRDWTARGCAVPRIAVNVSSKQLERRDFVDSVVSVVQETGDNPDALELEITESLLMHEVQESIKKLSILRGLGIQIAMDDFGTGYSSLSYLARLPISALKIDRSFVNAMAAGAQDLAIVSTVIALAHALRLTVVAEGVETAEQARLLALLDCNEAQGFLYSKPLPGPEIEALLRSQRPLGGPLELQSVWPRSEGRGPAIA